MINFSYYVSNDSNNGIDAYKSIFNDLDEKNYRTLLYDVTTILLKTFPIIVLIVGTIGNLLSFMILTGKKMRKTSTFCYLACLSLVDLSVVYTFSINFILNNYFNIDIQISSMWFCRTYAFLVYFLPQYSAWILVLVSVDRVIKIIMCSGKLVWSMKPSSFFIFKRCYRTKGNDTNQGPTVQLNGNNIKTGKKSIVTTTNNKRKAVNKFVKKWNTPQGAIISVSLIGIVLFVVNLQFFIFQIDQYSDISSINTLERNLLNHSFKLYASNLTNKSHLYESIQSYVRYRKMQIYEINPIICSPEHNPRYLRFYLNYWVHLDTLMNVFIPSAIMFISSLIICSTIHRSILKFRRRSRLVSVFHEHQAQRHQQHHTYIHAPHHHHHLHDDYDAKINLIKQKLKFFKKPTPSDSTSAQVSTMIPSASYNKECSDIKPCNYEPKIPSTMRRCSSVPNLIKPKIIINKAEKKSKKIHFEENSNKLSFTRVISLFNSCRKFIINLKPIKQKSLLRKPDKIYILIILVAINILFIVLTAPIVLYLSFQTEQIYLIDDMNMRIKMRFLKTICVFLMNTNHAINIMIYGKS